MGLKSSADTKRYPYQMRQRDFYCGGCHNRSLFLFLKTTLVFEKDIRFQIEKMKRQVMTEVHKREPAGKQKERNIYEQRID